MSYQNLDQGFVPNIFMNVYNFQFKQTIRRMLVGLEIQF